MAAEEEESEVLVGKKLSELKDDVDEIFSAFEGILRDDEPVQFKRHSVAEREKMAVLRQYLKQSASGEVQEKVQSLAGTDQARAKNTAGMSGEEAAELVQRVTEQLEGISQELVSKVEEFTSQNRDAMNKNVELQVAMENHQAQYSRLQTRLQKAIGEMNVARATCETLKKQVTEKNKEISRLNRQSNIILWEREKKKLVCASMEREADLLAELQSTNERIRDLKERTHQRLRRMNEELKREKMRGDLRIRQTASKDDPLLKIDDLQRQLFLSEKKLITACEEIRLQQKLFVGVLGGMKNDYRIVLSKWRLSKPAEEGESLANLMDLLYTSCAAGTLDSVRVDLPTHYQGLAKDITGYSSRLTMLTPKLRKHRDTMKDSKASQIQPVSLTQNTITEESMEHSRTLKRILSASSARRASNSGADIQSATTLTSSGEEWLDKGVSKKNSTSNREEEDDAIGIMLNQGGSPHAIVDVTKKSQLSGHPQLINLVTGLPNIKEAVNCFPELTDAQVRVHFSKFMSYDKSQDYTLDRSEVVTALTEIRGIALEETDIEAAFREIDLDGSESVDFYEYLSLNRILAHNSGRADLFKETRKLTSRGVVSKSCVIQ